jgi:putative transposase
MVLQIRPGLRLSDTPTAAKTGDKWHLDEVFLTINGKRYYLWRAVDQDDNVLDILVQSRRNREAAKKFFRKLLKGLHDVPRVVITDKLKSYGAAKREILPGVAHRQSRYLNNCCENSHRPTRQRERRIQGFKSAGHAQRFLSACGPIFQPFRPRRHLLSAAEYRGEMRNRFESWADMTGTKRTVYSRSNRWASSLKCALCRPAPI